jgi:hypothetical protein
LAAEQGYARAQGVLGQCYKEGAGVEQDDVLAYMWFDIATPYYNGALIDKGSLHKTMTQEQIAEAQKLSLEWKPKGQ